MPVCPGGDGLVSNLPLPGLPRSFLGGVPWIPGEAAPAAGDSVGFPGLPGLSGFLPLSVGVPRAAGLCATPGVAVTPGSSSRPGRPRPFPFSIGEPAAPGDATGLPAAVGAVTPGEASPFARPFAAAPVGGGIFFGFSVLIFCSTSALLATPAQPLSSFGCATFAFTFGGAAPAGALLSFCGAATMSLSPWTFVIAPVLAAADKSALVWRSILRR
jgi:hypothetical protein